MDHDFGIAPLSSILGPKNFLIRSVLEVLHFTFQCMISFEYEVYIKVFWWFCLFLFILPSDVHLLENKYTIY